MAFLCTHSFLAASGGTVDGGKVLEAKIRHALRNLTSRHGRPGSRPVANCPKAKDPERPVATVDTAGVDYSNPPVKLRQERDTLSDEWRAVWKATTIEYSDEETGASNYRPNNRVRIGPFFLKSEFTVTDMEKVVLHEYLHAALGIQSDMPGVDHGFINQALTNMGYKPPLNVAEQD